MMACSRTSMYLSLVTFLAYIFSIYSSNQGKSFTVTYRFDIFRHDIRRSSECLTVKKVDRESLFNQVHAPIGAWKVKLEIMID